MVAQVQPFTPPNTLLESAFDNMLQTHTFSPSEIDKFDVLRFFNSIENKLIDVIKREMQS